MPRIPKIFQRLILKIDEKRRKDILRKIYPYLNKQEKILDLGSGFCAVTKDLLDKGYDIIPVDIKNFSLFRDINPIIYDGQTLPFKDKEFSVVLLLTVLHHARDPIHILKEASRVSKRIIVMEDLIENVFQKYITFFVDSIVNLEFFCHPHSNKSKSEWEKSFRDLGFEILGFKMHNFWGFLTSITYHLRVK